MKTILFIEDEPTLQKEIGRYLEEEYEIISALDGEEGIEVAREKKPQLILLDLILPKKDGFEVLEEIKQDEELKDIPVIVLTNLEGSDEVQKALSLGAESYLIKANYDLEEVRQKIENNL